MKKKYHIYQMNLLILNIVSILLFIIVIILTIVINKKLFIESITIKNTFAFILIFLLYTILHELLHALSYVIHGAKYKNITYGCALEKGVLYCLCKQNISKKNILISLIYPFTFIGVITYIIALTLNLKTLLLLSIFNISGSAGDLIMFIFIIRLKNIEYSEFDDEISFGIYTKEDMTKHKPIGLKYVKEEEKLKIEDKTKIKISRPSIPILIILLLLGILDLAL